MNLVQMKAILADLAPGTKAHQTMGAAIDAKVQADADRKALRAKLGYTNPTTGEVIRKGDTLYAPGDLSPATFAIVTPKEDPSLSEDTQFVTLSASVATHVVKALGQNAKDKGGNYGSETVADYFGFSVLDSGAISVHDRLTVFNGTKSLDGLADLLRKKINDQKHRAQMTLLALEAPLLIAG